MAFEIGKTYTDEDLLAEENVMSSPPSFEKDKVYTDEQLTELSGVSEYQPERPVFETGKSYTDEQLLSFSELTTPVTPAITDEPEPSDIAITRGLKKASSALGFATEMATGDYEAAAENVANLQQYIKENPASKEAQELSLAWESGEGVSGGLKEVAREFGRDIEDAPTPWGSLKSVAKNVKAMGAGVIEMIPNMIAPTAGAVGGQIAGASAGSSLPIVGTAAGALVGMITGASAGNAMAEAQGIAIDAMHKAGVDLSDEKDIASFLEENSGSLLKKSAGKGAILGAVDALTLKLGSFLLRGPGQKAAKKALTDMGVDLTDKAAVKTATATPDFKRRILTDKAFLASEKGLEKTARNVSAAALEPLGEGLGEYVGSGVALGDWDVKNATLEAMASIGQSVMTFGGQKALQAATKLPDYNSPDTTTEERNRIRERQGLPPLTQDEAISAQIDAEMNYIDVEGEIAVEKRGAEIIEAAEEGGVTPTERDIILGNKAVAESTMNKLVANEPLTPEEEIYRDEFIAAKKDREKEQAVADKKAAEDAKKREEVLVAAGYDPAVLDMSDEEYQKLVESEQQQIEAEREIEKPEFKPDIKAAEKFATEDINRQAMEQVKAMGGISIESAKQMFSEDTYKQLSKPGLFTKEGQQIDDIATQLGYESANDLVNAWSETPLKKEDVEKAVKEQRAEFEIAEEAKRKAPVTEQTPEDFKILSDGLRSGKYIMTDDEIESLPSLSVKQKAELLEINNEAILKFSDQVNAVLKDRKQAEAVTSIVKARAVSAGMNPSEYLKKRGIQVVADSVDIGTEAERQSNKGAVDLSKEGQAVIHAFESADISTMVHELGHVFRADLSGDELRVATEWATKDGKWDRAAEEKFARGWEKYITTGQAPNAELKSLFEKFKNWMLEVYKSLTHPDINVDITPEIRRVFDSLVSVDTKVKSQGLSQSEANILFHSAYHGTPHEVDKFSMEKIGTGEGAQAYGYGLYFTDNREVADWYRNKLSSGRIGATLDGEEYFIRMSDIVDVYGRPVSDINYDIIHSMFVSDYDKKEAEEDLRYRWEQSGRDMGELDAAIEKMNRVKEKIPEGKLYKVELAPKENEYLLWDKPISEQSDNIKRIFDGKSQFNLSSFGRDVYLSIEMAFSHGDRWAMRAAENMGYDPYSGEFGAQPADKLASEYLQSLGIRGIKYLAGVSRAKGEGDYNYVIFSDEDIEITDVLMQAAPYTPEQQASLVSGEAVGVRGEPVVSDGVLMQEDTLPVDTESPEFKQWFGNSKVVDEYGKLGDIQNIISKIYKSDYGVNSISNNDLASSDVYVHGRSEGEELISGGLVLTTQDMEVAKNYGTEGSIHFFKPINKERVLDLSNPYGPDMGKVIDVLNKRDVSFIDDYVDGGIDEGTGELIPIENLPEDEQRYIRNEALREAFTPDDIVDSAAGFDNPDYLTLFYDAFGGEYDFVVTPDGGVVLNPEGLESHSIPWREEWDYEGKSGDLEKYIEQQIINATLKEEDFSEPVTNIYYQQAAPYTPEQQDYMDTGGFGVRPKKTVKQRFDEAKVLATDKLRQGIVDQFHSLRSILKDDVAWMMSHLTKSDTGVLMTAINQGMPVWEKSGAIDIKPGSKSLKEILSPLGENTDRFFAWVAANRAERLSAEDRENLFTDKQIAAGKTLNKGFEDLFETARNEFEELGSGIVDIAVKTGLVNADEAQQWKDEGFYVPFYRMLEEQTKGTRGPSNIQALTNQKAYKKLKGGKAQLEDLLTNTLSNWNHLISAGLRNQAGKKALETAENMGLATQVPKEIKSKDAIYVRDNGQEVWYELDNSPEGSLVLDSLVSLNYEGMNNVAMKSLRMFKRALTTGVTASPGFKIRNLIRDSLHAPAVSTASKNPLKNIAVGIKDRETMKRMEAGGGAFSQEGYIYGSDPDAIKRLVGVSRENILNTPGKIKRLWRKYENFGNMLENVNRVASFQKDLAKGKTLLEANFNSRDQMDFARSGSFPAIRMLAQTVPFFNARLQGLDKLGRAVMDEEQRKQFAQVVGMYSLASVALMLAMKDDNDYEEAEEWEKRTYHLFKVPGSDQMYRIPRPFEVGAIAYLTEQMTKTFLDENEDIKDLGSALSHTLTDTLAMNPIPQAFKPLIELYANKSMFTGRDIETAAMKRLSKKERFKPWTSQTAQKFSAGMSNLLPESMTLSPVQTQHLVRGYTGWAGSQVLAATDFLIKKMTGQVDPEVKISEYKWNPVESLSREEETKNSKYVTKFYENLDILSREWADIQRYRERGLGEQIPAAVRRRTLVRKRYNRLSAKLSKLRKKEERIYKSKTMTATAKREAISRLRRQKNILTKNIVRLTEGYF